MDQCGLKRSQLKTLEAMVAISHFDTIPCKFLKDFKTI
jgi:hypothetical protein